MCAARQGNIAVAIHIDEGPQWVVDDLAIHGATQFKPAELPSLASSTGQPFSEVNIANDRETMLTFYYTRGFPKASFNASWQTGDARARQRGLHTSRKATASTFARC